MVQISNIVAAAAVSGGLLANVALAHPGHDVHLEYAQRAASLAATPSHKRSLAHCSEKLKARGHEARMYARRQNMAEKLKKKRSLQNTSYLKARDLDTVLNTDHHSNMTGITADTDPSVLFSSNSSCLLTPEVTQGPYYVTGEYVRQDITESGEGVALTVDIQVIDVETCEPIPDVLVDFWHCNSTGVYSGIVASGNGDSSDAANVNNTFLRGIQQTDQDGVLTFDTLFPGHYTGRTNHVHVLANMNATILPNKTITGGHVGHVGQIFFDQDLISLVEAVEPYASNTQDQTLNSEDSILSQEAEDVDPIIEYVLLGDSVSDGVFAWISFGMNGSASYTVNPAANYGENGGVQNESSGQGGPGGNGTMPTGAPPSGVAPTGSSPTGTSVAGVDAIASSASSSIASRSRALTFGTSLLGAFTRSAGGAPQAPPSGQPAPSGFPPAQSGQSQPPRSGRPGPSGLPPARSGQPQAKVAQAGQPQSHVSGQPAPTGLPPAMSGQPQPPVSGQPAPTGPPPAMSGQPQPPVSGQPTPTGPRPTGSERPKHQPTA